MNLGSPTSAIISEITWRVRLLLAFAPALCCWLFRSTCRELGTPSIVEFQDARGALFGRLPPPFVWRTFRFRLGLPMMHRIISGVKGRGRRALNGSIRVLCLPPRTVIPCCGMARRIRNHSSCDHGRLNGDWIRTRIPCGCALRISIRPPSKYTAIPPVVCESRVKRGKPSSPALRVLAHEVVVAPVSLNSPRAFEGRHVYCSPYHVPGTSFLNESNTKVLSSATKVPPHGPSSNQ